MTITGQTTTRDPTLRINIRDQASGRPQWPLVGLNLASGRPQFGLWSASMASGRPQWPLVGLNGLWSASMASGRPQWPLVGLKGLWSASIMETFSSETEDGSNTKVMEDKTTQFFWRGFVSPCGTERPKNLAATHLNRSQGGGKWVNEPQQSSRGSGGRGRGGRASVRGRIDQVRQDRGRGKYRPY